jgi:hypothetical protein
MVGIQVSREKSLRYTSIPLLRNFSSKPAATGSVIEAGSMRGVAS